jgi:predicted phosphodiesterase
MRRAAFFFILAALALAQSVPPAVYAATIAASTASSGQPAGEGVPVQPGGLTLPLKPNSVRFGVIGDSGTGDRNQYEVAEQMAKYHEKFPFDFVIMLGDNLYGGDKPRDFDQKFERPYKALLDAGVKFYASLGNHDNPNERFYKPFNMSGERYYAFKKGNVGFFALDGNYMSPQQLNWVNQQLESTDSAWKICFFHQPLYSDGKFHGPDLDLRTRLEPLLQKYGVNVVFSGHEHIYERIMPQHGIYYFVLGNSGELRLHNLRPSAEMTKGFDTDRDFMLVEIAGDELYFQAISRTGQTVDSDTFIKQRANASPLLPANPGIPTASNYRFGQASNRTAPQASTAPGRSPVLSGKIVWEKPYSTVE